jgi:predicted TIM-barrel fold metal-dependent hydrolase
MLHQAAAMIPTCQPPQPIRRTLQLVCPEGAIDCHVHVYGPEASYPIAATARFRAPDAVPQTLNQVHAALGIKRAVLVQPSTYGTDNRRHLNAMAELDRPARMVASVSFDVADAELKRLHAAGVRGTRFAVGHPGGPAFEDIRRFADRLAPLGWHIEFHVRREAEDATLARAEAVLRDMPIDVCIAHLASIEPGLGLDQPDVKFLCDWLRKGRCWIKLSGGYRMSAKPPYRDLFPFAQAFVAARPDRMLWGSDWPHVDVHGPMPDTVDQLDYLLDWVPDPGQRHAILITNPEILYQF